MASPERQTVAERAEQDLLALMHRHAELRAQLELHVMHVKEVEERFLALRPGPRADERTVAEIKKRMVLARPWREELNATYQAMLRTIQELDQVVRRIHEAQGVIARSLSAR